MPGKIPIARRPWSTVVLFPCFYGHPRTGQFRVGLIELNSRAVRPGHDGLERHAVADFLQNNRRYALLSEQPALKLKYE